MCRIFEVELAKAYHADALPRPLPADTRLYNEDTLQPLDYVIMPVVNNALKEQKVPTHFGNGTRCGYQIKPDWSCIYADQPPPRGDEFPELPRNDCPGDTKKALNFHSGTDLSDPVTHREWAKVVGQVTGYMGYYGVRCGLVITDEELVVLRLTRVEPEEGLVAGRKRRDVAPASYTAEDIPEVSVLSIDDPRNTGDTSVLDDNTFDWTYYGPEYASIPWSASGPNKLTVKLGLFFLGMLAATNNQYIDFSYSGLDTWRFDGSSFVHNSSGIRRDKLKSGQQQDPPPAEGEASGSTGTGEAWTEYAATSGGLPSCACSSAARAASASRASSRPLASCSKRCRIVCL